MSVSRHLQPDGRPRSRRGLDLEAAAQAASALLHRGQAQPPRAEVGRPRVEAGAVVGDLEDDLDVEPARAREILRIAQEALANALRHADAEHVSVRLGAEDGRLVLEVRDDGVGFDPDAAAVRSRRLGLTSMEERAQRLGGRLTLRSEPGAGTTVRLEATRA